MEALEIPKQIFLGMQSQARREAPVEACGILAGSGARVSEFYEMTNADKSTDHFMMDPQEQFAAIKDMRAKSLDMLGIYHSHPASAARPSAEDIRLALTPGVLYVILSLQGPDEPAVRAFRIEEGEVSESAVEIIEEFR